MTTPPTSYDWVREIKPDLKQLDSIPLTGTAPPFPWSDLSYRLALSLDREGLTIQPSEITWRAKENLYEGLGDNLTPLNFSIPSLSGQVSWVMPEQEISILLALLLTKETHPLPLNDPALSKSFYHFLALEVLYNFTQVSADKTLLPILINQQHLPDRDSLCWDVSINIQNHTIWGRLIISPEFRQSWVEHFAQQNSSLLSQQMKQLVDIIIHLEAGKTHMTLAEWKSVQLGDFILLDSCSLDIEKLEGRVMLNIHGKQAFRAKLKEGTLKILELPLLHEVETSMVKQPNNDEDDLSDLDFPEENDELEEEEDIFSDEDLFSGEEDLESQATLESQTTNVTNTQEEAAMETTEETIAPEKTDRLLSPEQIPMTLVVEVGQIQMNMEQLLKLEPGNLLEIDIHPKNGVDLTLNGKVVAKGELIRIGEMIGVRILELGR